MTEFGRLLSYLRPYATIFALSVLLLIATGLLEGATSVLLVPIFDKLAGAQAAAWRWSSRPTPPSNASSSPT